VRAAIVARLRSATPLFSGETGGVFVSGETLILRPPLMLILALRIFLTPFLVIGATLAGRRWGPSVGGWLIGFPLNSAPVSLILALQYGSEFATRAGIGTLAGLASLCAFNFAYALISRKANWWVSSLATSIVYFIATWVWNIFALPLIPTFIIVVSAIGLVIWLVPGRTIAPNPIPAPRWDLPLRVFIATIFVIAITGSAAVLGAQLSGLLTPFPIFGTVLAAFAHRQQGADAAIQLLRGMTLSLFGVAGFFLVVCGLLSTLALVWTYSLAAAVVLISYAIALQAARRHIFAPES
jgi:hypothetical protein